MAGRAIPSSSAKSPMLPHAIGGGECKPRDKAVGSGGIRIMTSGGVKMMDP